ncbi:MAG TPA: aldolase/citrate lyase family protein [Kiritimatiellia bacterium]|nr:aldolase/citrate lyase family protein [Kiritimatiellia bacterium]HRU69718.1 aldolase/citrate lyase family protein [Kiritimatiellia bacterium]
MNPTAIQHLRSPSFHLGTWLSLGSPVITELAGLCGFDWLLIDLEHGAVGESTLFASLQVLRGSRSAAIVRVGAPHPDLIQRALDWGADGIMVPHVDTAEQACAAVRAARFAPHGTRGFSRSVRALDYGMTQEPPSAPPLVLAQIESAAAVSHADEIAAVDGIDVLFVGPADLNFDLKATASTLTYTACLQRVAEAARTAGKQAGILNRNAQDTAALHAQGYTVQAIDSDLAILRQRYRDLVQNFDHLRVAGTPSGWQS